MRQSSIRRSTIPALRAAFQPHLHRPWPNPFSSSSVTSRAIVMSSRHRRGRRNDDDLPGNGVLLLAIPICWAFHRSGERRFAKVLKQARDDAYFQGQSVADFRAESRWEIDRWWNPFSRFYGRKWVESECGRLTDRYNYDKRRDGLPEGPRYRQIEVEMEWGTLGKVVRVAISRARSLCIDPK